MPGLPLVLVSSDFRAVDGMNWHMTPTTYVEAVLYGAGATPVLLPALGSALDLDGALDRVDGVLLSGSKSNVHPSLYGEEPTPDHEPYDPARDATTLPLIRLALAKGVPLFAICRGYQELNVALGGTLHTEIQSFEGRMDHRAPEAPTSDQRYAIRHKVQLVREGCIGRVLGSQEIDVNSLHRQGIATLSDRLVIEATAPDGTIEAVSVRDATAFAVGVQWHPEYWVRSDHPSSRLFAAFGEAIRARAAGR
ncbi:MAG: gamma-glutamyl-gamma-aminobutyrate hydrolase family protein [Siculibacillus sp.]|nr:gamma-glutamyl-gamma-aminobutyrate hydrolase family protein [Siculibacillus sp.]